MKKWNKVFIIIAILVILFSLLYAFFILSAKTIIAKKIEQLTGCKTTIGKLSIIPPLNIEIRNLNINGLARAGYVYLSPSIPNLLFGRVAFNKVKIKEPEITYQRTAPVVPIKDSRAVILEITPPVEKSVTVPVTKNKSLPVMIKNLKVYSGRLNFIDTTATKGVINFIVKDINIYITNISNFNTKSISNFNLKGRISWNTGEPDGKVSLDGEADFYKKDISATLKVEDIDAIVFFPYYSTWVNLEKAHIEKAKLNFTSNIKGVNNDVSAACHLELIDIVRKVRLPDEPQQKAERLTDAVLDMFKTMNQGKVVLDFTLHTKMDQPEFSFGNIKSAFEGKLMQARTSAGMRPQDVLLWPGKMLQSGLRSGTELTKAAVDGVFAIGNGLKKVFEDAMNKEVSVN